jgi:hypothetical protein
MSLRSSLFWLVLFIVIARFETSGVNSTRPGSWDAYDNVEDCAACLSQSQRSNASSNSKYHLVRLFSSRASNVAQLPDLVTLNELGNAQWQVLSTAPHQQTFGANTVFNGPSGIAVLSAPSLLLRRSWTSDDYISFSHDAELALLLYDEGRVDSIAQF